MRFKVGDKVRCIRPDAETKFPKLKRGNIYTVKYQNSTVVGLLETSGLFFASRFEPFSEFQVGDAVKCLDARDTNRLRLYSRYIIDEIPLIKEGKQFICLTNVRGCFLASRFEPVHKHRPRRKRKSESESRPEFESMSGPESRPEPKPEYTSVPDYVTKTVENASPPQAMWRLK